MTGSTESLEAAQIYGQNPPTDPAGWSGDGAEEAPYFLPPWEILHVIVGV